MKVSTKGRYALRVMIDLAIHNTGEPVPLKDVAERQDISLKYLEQIISLLIKAGFVSSIRGSSGGYRLSRDPSKYTAGEIIRAAEGDIAPVPCLGDTPQSCSRSAECAAISFWSGLYRTVNEYMDSVILQNLAEESLHGGAYDYSI